MKALYLGNVLPSAGEYEEGDLFILIPASELYVRSGGNWVLIGSNAFTQAVTDGQNIGSAQGEVFSDKQGTVLRFRTIGNDDGSLNVYLDGDRVVVDLATTGTNAPVTDAANVGGGAQVYRDKTGNTLNFRTLVGGANGAVSVYENGDEIVIELDDTYVYTDAQNEGGGPGEVYDDANSAPPLLLFRTLDNSGVGYPVLYGTDGDVVKFRGIGNHGTGADIFDDYDDDVVLARRIQAGDGIDISVVNSSIVVAHKGARLMGNTYHSLSLSRDSTTGHWWGHADSNEWTYDVEGCDYEDKLYLVRLEAVFDDGGSTDAPEVDMLVVGFKWSTNNYQRLFSYGGSEPGSNIHGVEWTNHITGSLLYVGNICAIPQTLFAAASGYSYGIPYATVYLYFYALS